MKNLLDTIQMMVSKDFKERFKAEYWQLKIRSEKLGEMCRKHAAGELDFTPSCNLDLLQKQLGYMQNYLDCLELRAEIENIDISDLPEIGVCANGPEGEKGEKFEPDGVCPPFLEIHLEEKEIPRILIYEEDGKFCMDILADMEITKVYEMIYLAMVAKSAEEEKKLGLPEGSLFLLRFQKMVDNLK